MLKNRVIPVLLLRNGGLVKTTRFADPRYIGDPLNAIRIFNEKEVDELLVIDIMATREKRGPNYAVIKELAGECFMPLCYGGGISTLEQAERIFALGVEKVSIQSATRSSLSLVSEIANRFGSQAVVVSIDIRSGRLGGYQLYWSAIGATGSNWLEHMQRAVDAGAGEVLVNAVDRDGTMAGVDTRLIGLASEAVRVPVVALGGVGSLDDIKKAVDAGASAVAAGAFFVFQGRHRAVLITYPSYASLEQLLSGNR